MKKYFTLILFICIFALAGCSNSTAIGDSAKDIGENAAEALTDHLVSMGTIRPDMQMEGGEKMMWEEYGEREIAGVQCYVFDLLYSEDEDINGVMAGRLFSSYAISKDGMEIYCYNPADDIWEQMLSGTE